jgi:hypothetical protein
MGWSQMEVPIPPYWLDESHRLFAQEGRLTQGISVYEEAVKQGENKSTEIPWPLDLVEYYRVRIMKTRQLHSAYQAWTPFQVCKDLAAEELRKATPQP